MTYKKPEITKLQDAMDAIKNELSKEFIPQDNMPGSTKTVTAAYESDE